MENASIYEDILNNEVFPGVEKKRIGGMAKQAYISVRIKKMVHGDKVLI